MDTDTALWEPLQRRGEVFAEGYVIAELAGVGGMGLVYSAVETRRGRTVAIKVPRPELAADSYVRRRFRAEAIAGACIDHPCVVQLLESGEWLGTPYLVMEYVSGRSLGELGREVGPMAVEQALPIVQQMLAALAIMHDQGIIHGDVKTENALVDTNAAVKLIDLGLARFVDDRGAATWDGVVSGTPEYLAPELRAGEAPSFASDQYASCVTVYELLAGVVPFGGTTSDEIGRRQLECEVVPLAGRNPALAAFDPILRRGLAKRASDRFPDMRAFAAALRAAVPVRPSRARHCSVPAHGARVRHRDSINVVRCRRLLAAAVEADAIEAIVTAYFELVAALVAEHRIASAIAELESATGLLAGHDEVAYSEAQWRIELALAALYDGRGDTSRSQRLAHAARDHAAGCGSSVGMQRAAALLARLVHARERTTSVERPSSHR